MPILHSLPWLPVWQQVIFQTAVNVHLIYRGHSFYAHVLTVENAASSTTIS